VLARNMAVAGRPDGPGKVLYMICSSPDCSYRTVQKYYRGLGPDLYATELLGLKKLHEMTFDGHSCDIALRVDTDQDVIKAYTRVKHVSKGSYWYTGPLSEGKADKKAQLNEQRAAVSTEEITTT
jgi:hypothetical protein